MTAAALLAIVAGVVNGPLAPTAELHYFHAGVSCRTPNSIACDRYGLAGALQPRPHSVVAVVGGRQLPLARSNRGSPQWVGHLRDAGLARTLAASGAIIANSRWNGAGAPVIGARIVATFADGHREVLPALTRLCAGWG